MDDEPTSVAAAMSRLRPMVGTTIDIENASVECVQDMWTVAQHVIQSMDELDMPWVLDCQRRFGRVMAGESHMDIYGGHPQMHCVETDRFTLATAYCYRHRSEIL